MVDSIFVLTPFKFMHAQNAATETITSRMWIIYASIVHQSESRKKNLGFALVGGEDHELLRSKKQNNRACVYCALRLTLRNICLFILTSIIDLSVVPIVLANCPEKVSRELSLSPRSPFGLDLSIHQRWTCYSCVYNHSIHLALSSCICLSISRCQLLLLLLFE